MTATTIDHPTQLNLGRPVIRLALATAAILALLLVAFVVGRTTAPAHTVTTGISAGSSVDVCHLGRIC